MITSTNNEKIKNVGKCMKQAKERKKQGVFLVEGIRMFSEIPKDNHVESYVTEEFFEAHPRMFDNISYELVSDNVMDFLSDTKTPQGVISVVKQFSHNISEICKLDDTEACNPLVIALENIQDPGNLGTIIRTAEGAGVTGIIMSRDTVDIYNPKVVPQWALYSEFHLPTLTA